MPFLVKSHTNKEKTRNITKFYNILKSLFFSSILTFLKYVANIKLNKVKQFDSYFLKEVYHS